MIKILVLDPLSAEFDKQLIDKKDITIHRQYNLSTDEIFLIIDSYDVVVIKDTILDSRVLSHVNTLKVICLLDGKLDVVDQKIIKQKNITLLKITKQDFVSIAEYIMGMIFLLSRKGLFQCRTLDPQKYFLPSKIEGKNLGLIGFGNIGKELTKKAKSFNMNTLVYNFGKKENFPENEITILDNLSLLAKNSDFIVFIEVPNDTSQKIIRASFLEQTKETACFISTASLKWIDSSYLLKYFIDHKLSGMALDVEKKEEKFVKDFPSLPNCIISIAEKENTIENLFQTEKILAKRLLSYYDK